MITRPDKVGPTRPETEPLLSQAADGNALHVTGDVCMFNKVNVSLPRHLGRLLEGEREVFETHAWGTLLGQA